MQWPGGACISIRIMNADKFISWLIHSDWYLVGGWIVSLAVAVVLSFTRLAPKLNRSRTSQTDEPPA
jgi:hypothetical protein